MVTKGQREPKEIITSGLTCDADVGSDHLFDFYTFFPINTIFSMTMAYLKTHGLISCQSKAENARPLWKRRKKWYFRGKLSIFLSCPSWISLQHLSFNTMIRTDQQRRPKYRIGTWWTAGHTGDALWSWNLKNVALTLKYRLSIWQIFIYLRFRNWLPMNNRSQNRKFRSKYHSYTG